MNKIIELQVDKVAAVDQPANKRRFLLVKSVGARASPPISPETPGSASSPSKGTSMHDVVKKMDLSPFGLTDEAQDQLRKSVQEAVETATETAVEEAVEAARADEPEATEDVEKADLPEPVRKRIEQAEAQVAELRKAARTSEFITKAEKLTILGGDVTERADMLMKVADGNAEAFQALEAQLAAAQAQANQSDLFKAVGADGRNESGDAPIRKRAEEIRKTENLTMEQALVKAYREDPSAYDAQVGAQ